MKWLVLVHVLSAIIGVGPTFFMHALVRRKQNIGELRHSMAMMHKLELFPKIGGSIAVLSGLALIIFFNYGSFLQLWLIGALILYVVIQILVIGFVAPLGKRLGASVFAPNQAGDAALTTDQSGLLSRIHSFTSTTTVLGILLFAMMIMKPALHL